MPGTLAEIMTIQDAPDFLRILHSSIKKLAQQAKITDQELQKYVPDLF